MLRRTEEHVDAIRSAATDLTAVLPTRIEAAVARALASPDGGSLPRHVSEIHRAVTSIAEAVRVVSRDLQSERLGRVGDLEVLVDLIASSAESTRGDLQRLDRRVAAIESALTTLADTVSRLVPTVENVNEKLDRRIRISVQTDPATTTFAP